jgi:hypothetical protein
MSTIYSCPHCGDRWSGEHDEHQCAETLGENASFRLTPKGSVIATAQAEGLSGDAARRIWEALEAHCMRLLEGDGEYAALIFDGEGGTVIGATVSNTTD